MSLVVPWVATQPSVARQMLQMASVGAEDVVYDLGCGDGRLLIIAVTEFGAKKAVGYEIRQELYEACVHSIEQASSQDRIVVIKRNLFEADLSEASVIALYLSNEANELLRPKLEKEARFGTRIVSHQFRIDGWRTTRRRAVGYFPGVAIYLYVIPECFIAEHFATS